MLFQTGIGREVALAIRQAIIAVIWLTLVVETSVAADQTFSESLKADPRANYFIIKRLTKPLTNFGVIENFSADRDYKLGTCRDGPNFGDGHLGGYSHLAKQLGQLAAIVVTFKADLKGLHYPESAWRPMLLNFEENELKYLSSNPSGDIHDHQLTFQKALAAALQQYRLRSAPLLPKVVDDGDGECGAGEVGVTISSDPPHARIQLITTFTYLVCKAKNLEPDRANTKCDGWYDAPEKPRVSGSFKYKATWPDGVTHIDNLNADGLEDGGVLTLHLRGCYRRLPSDLVSAESYT